MIMDWTSSMIPLVSVMLGAGGIGTLLNRRYNRRKAKAEADAAEWELYDRRLDELHETVAHLNSTEKEHAERIATLNRALDDKTERIRRLTDLLYSGGQNLNRANDKITALTAENGNLRLDLMRFRNWHCRNAGCDGRVPPNPSLKGKEWNDSEDDNVVNVENHK